MQRERANLGDDTASGKSVNGGVNREPDMTHLSALGFGDLLAEVLDELPWREGTPR